MKKSHIIFCALFSLGLIILNFLPKLVQAGGDDIQSFQVEGSEVFRLTKQGGIVVSSDGVTGNEGLVLFHEILYQPPISSMSYFVNPEFKITTTALKGNNTNLQSGATTYLGEPAASVLIQPVLPRTLEIRVDDASGSIVIKGTDTFNRPRTETIYFTSDTVARGVIPWIGISSFTITITTVEVTQSSATFFVGSSTGIGIPWRIEYATDVTRMYKDKVWVATHVASEMGVNTAESTVSIGSTTLGNRSSVWDIYGISRKTIYAPVNPPKER